MSKNRQHEYTLAISNPCQEDWNSMKASHTGKFCLNCQKQVIDFTHCSDLEIIKIIEATEGRICGRLNREQMDRVLVASYQTSSNSVIPKIFAGLLGLSSLVPPANATEIQAQEMLYLQRAREGYEENVILQSALVNDTTKNIIQGVVIDSEGKEPLIAANVNIKHTSVGVSTDIDGSFKLVVPDELLTDSIYLVINYIGFKTAEIKVNKIDLPANKNIILYPSSYILTGDIVIVKSTKNARKRKSNH